MDFSPAGEARPPVADGEADVPAADGETNPTLPRFRPGSVLVVGLLVYRRLI